MHEGWTGIIERWSSAVALGADIGVNPVTVRWWKRNGAPGRYWNDIEAAAQRRGIEGVTVKRMAELAATARSTAA